MSLTCTIYHNPRCSKSRQGLVLLRSRGIEPRIIEYLEQPPSEENLDEILKKLGSEPHDIVRKNEEIYMKLGLKDKNLSRAEMIRILVRHPILIERPIVVSGERAVVGRPPEKILEVL